MTNETITLHNHMLSPLEITNAQELLKFALITKPDLEKALIILNKYYNKNNPIFDINISLPGLNTFTPLDMACFSGSTKIVEFLLKNGAKPNGDNEYTIPLHLASARNHMGCVYYLLKYGADINKPNKVGQTGLMRACEAGHNDMVQLFLLNNLGIRPEIMVTCKDGLTCLDYALNQEHYEIIQIIEHIKMNKAIKMKEEGKKRTKI